MKLPQPIAGTSPGRAARAQTVQPSQTGAAMGQLGETMFKVGTAIEADRLDREFARAQVDLTRDLNDLRLEVEQMGDPDAADRHFRDRSNALRDTYLTGTTEDGRPRISERNAERFGLAFEDLANRHAFQVGARNLALRQSQRLATYNDYVAEAVRGAANADADTREVFIANGEQIIAGLLESGAIDPEGAQKLRADLASNVTWQAAVQKASDNPAEFLERADAGEWDQLHPKVLAEMRLSVQANLAKAAASEAREAEAARRLEVKTTKGELSRIASLSDSTRLAPDDLAFVNSPQVVAMAEENPEVALERNKVLARMSIDQSMPDWEKLSPTQLAALILEERAKPVTHEYQEERLEVLEDLYAARTKALADDPVAALTKDMGYKIPPLQLDGSLEDLAQDLYTRSLSMRDFQESGYLDEFVVFSNDEARAIKARLASDADPQDRFELVESMAAVLGADGPDVVFRATGNRTVAHAVDLSVWGGSRDAIADILTGEKKIADGTANRPNASSFREAFYDLTTGRFEGQPELQARLLRAAEAIYVVNAPVEDSGSIDSDLARAAINRALGGDGRDSDLARGGIASIDPPGLVNQYELILPPSVQARAARRRIDEIWGGDPAAASAAFSAAARAAGAQIDLGDDPGAILGDLTIAPWWSDGRPADRYILLRQTATGPVAVSDTEGRPFYFSLEKLVGK